MLKKLTVAILLALFLLVSIFTPIAQAQEGVSWYNQDFKEWYLKVYDINNQSEIFGERYTAAQVQWILYTLLSIPFNVLGYNFTSCLFGGDAGNCIKALVGATESNFENVSQKKSSAKDLVLALFEDRPLSGITYTKNIARKFHIIPQVEAQEGFGFSRLDPVLPMWRTVRNFSYAIFVLLIVVLAFMIMFRVKISPQLVITVQSALPKIAIALVLVTFSYAIAGFLVDLMYVFIGIIALFFNPQDPLSVFAILTKGGTDPLPLTSNLYPGIFLPMVGYIILAMITLVATFFFQAGVFGSAGILAATVAIIAGLTGVSGGAFLLVLLLIGAVILFLLFLVIIWQFIRTIWMFIKAFANILILTILAPLQIAFGVVIPSVGFGAWLRSIAGNLAVFPVAGFLLLLSYRFLLLAFLTAAGDFIEADNLQKLYILTIGRVLEAGSLGTTSPSWPPLLGGEALVPLLFVGVSIVIFSLIPKAADIIKSMIEGKPFAYGTAIGEAFGPAKIAALYGTAEGMNIKAEQAKAAGLDIPAWIQVGRRLLGLKA